MHDLRTKKAKHNVKLSISNHLVMLTSIVLLELFNAKLAFSLGQTLSKACQKMVQILVTTNNRQIVIKNKTIFITI